MCMRRAMGVDILSGATLPLVVRSADARAKPKSGRREAPSAFRRRLRVELGVAALGGAFARAVRAPRTCAPRRGHPPDRIRYELVAPGVPARAGGPRDGAAC